MERITLQFISFHFQEFLGSILSNYSIPQNDGTVSGFRKKCEYIQEIETEFISIGKNRINEILNYPNLKEEKDEIKNELLDLIYKDFNKFAYDKNV